MKKNRYLTLFQQIKTEKNVKWIKISYAAEQQIYKIIKKEKKTGIKLGIKKSGCAGAKYYMQLIEKIHPSDISFVSEKILILINSKYLSMLEKIQIDYIKKGINYNFQFKNHKIKNFCGCGESFDIEKYGSFL
ncbi:MAG: iron-sulfur cluster assembly accessory protein [Buchnera aphidicola (Nurudea yanoniella)]